MGLSRLILPSLVCHADWSKDAKKRWFATAVLEDGRYLAHSPRKVGEVEDFLPSLRRQMPDDGCAIVGFDFPIGVPAFYARSAGIRDFKTFLSQLGKEQWRNFFKVCREATDISVNSPFYPHAPGGKRQHHLTDALKVPCMDLLLRECERRTEQRKAACSLFWTLGANQVGRAACAGWRDVLIPSLSKANTAFWPFDGDFSHLFTSTNLVIAETYPAEYYQWFFSRPLKGKGKIDIRKRLGCELMGGAESAKVQIAPDLKVAIEQGFIEGDDAFDAVVGLLGMLHVIQRLRPSGEPEGEDIKKLEGWILGRPSGRRRQ